MTSHIRPSKQGQVVRPLLVEDASGQYLVVDDLENMEPERLVKVCSISELQRSHAAGRAANLEHFDIDQLVVLAEDLQSFIESFNGQNNPVLES
jgi:hypothetical protein